MFAENLLHRVAMPGCCHLLGQAAAYAHRNQQLGLQPQQPQPQQQQNGSASGSFGGLEQSALCSALRLTMAASPGAYFEPVCACIVCWIISGAS